MDQTAVGTADRRVYLVGMIEAAHDYAAQRNIPRGRYQIVNSPRSLLGRRPEDCWIVMLPTFWDLPQHYWLAQLVRKLQREGAHVEWV